MDGSDGGLARQIERIFRYTHILATAVRNEMIGNGRGEELEELIRSPRALPAELQMAFRIKLTSGLSRHPRHNRSSHTVDTARSAVGTGPEWPCRNRSDIVAQASSYRFIADHL